MSDLDPTFLGLRERALDAARSGAVASSARAGTLGVVVDIPASGGFATLVALGDNTTSLYTSTGGGTIGAGSHQAVASATQHLLAAIDANRESFTDIIDDDFPPPANVRFHGLSAGGSFMTDVPEDSFWGRVAHPLMPVIAATQELITAVSAVWPGLEQNCGTAAAERASSAHDDGWSASTRVNTIASVAHGAGGSG